MPVRLTSSLRSEGKLLLQNPTTYAFIAVALLLALATIFSSPDEQNALLFMVAGRDPNRVGGAIGFIGNLIDAQDVAGSAARTSFVFTMLWIPSIIIYAVVATAQDFASASYDVSKARGIAETALVSAKLLPRSVFCCFLYILSCGTSFLYKLIQYGSSITLESFARFAGPAALGAIVLVSLYVETFALYQITRSVAATSVIAVVFSLFVMAWFPSTYGDGTNLGSILLYLSPVFYLMNVCALSFQTVGAVEVLLYVTITIPLMMLVSIGALKIREVF